LAAKANALKDRDNKTTAMMKANAMREKMELKAMKELWREDVVELQEVEQIPTRPKDLEKGESSGSEVNLYYSPKT
jgi:high-affinity K+ transport system ATPase subunit B